MTDFVLQITDWYRQNSRDLPWRSTKNAYFIWLSEVILQQTRVDQGRSYYEKFVAEFPIIDLLAAAEEEKVLKLWQGLGYYSRARNLHRTAKLVVEHFNGTFPANYKELLSLKGIGPYTAAAIASFAYDLPHAVVDGNVYRVLSRYFGIDDPIDSTIGKKNFQLLADSLIPHNAPALFNQAIMEYGALVCTPVNPDCEGCALVASCASGRSKLYLERPVKEKKTKVRHRYFHYFHSEKDGQICLLKRTAKDVWQELYEFPMIETESATDDSNEKLVQLIQNSTRMFEAKHILSHQQIHATFYKTNELPFEQATLGYIPLGAFQNYPIHRLMEKYWEDYSRKTNQKKA